MGTEHREPSDPPQAISERPRLDDGLYVSAGEVIGGKYRVEHVLGVGGMAFVLSAKHVDLDERFALKFLARPFLRDRVIIERFTREAKAACKIRSEHVARVYDVGSHEGAPYLVMEHLEGRDLSAVVAEGGAVHVEDAVEWTMQACEALAAAHAHGIVHRDIKPENLFLVERDGLPTIKLLDFGISKIALTGGEPGSRLTGQLTLGTPCYMAPEQIRSTASADARSDLWSLGVVLYELLSGTEAFKGTTITEMCAAVLEQQPPPLRRIRPDVPPELAAVVARCMEKDPARRFGDVGELAVALLPFAPSRALVSAERSVASTRSAPRLLAATPSSSMTPAPFAISARFTPSELPDLDDEEDLDDGPRAAEPISAARPARSIGWFAAGAAVLAVVSVAAVSFRARPAEPSAAAAANLAPTETAQQPLVEPSGSSDSIRLPAVTKRAAATAPLGTAVAGSAVRALPAPSLRPRASASHAPPIAPPSSEPSAHPAASHAPPPKTSAPPAASPAPGPAAPPTVELGY